MPEDIILKNLTEQDAKVYKNIFTQRGATVTVFQMDGAFALMVVWPATGPTPIGEDISEEASDLTDVPIETGADGMPSTPRTTDVPFAPTPAAIGECYWPVITADANAMVVSQKTVANKLIGREGRRFLADRSNGRRYHVGVDLFCSDGEEVVSITAGVIVAFYKFYKTNAGEQSYALFVDHGDFVVNYGEVKADSPQRYGWSVGSTVAAGQKIARVSTTHMIHFEAYTGDARANQRWMKNEPNPPSELRDPTKLLVALSVSGKRLHPGGVAVQPSVAYNGPLPGTASWHRRFGGQSWRYDQRGVYTESRGTDPWRSSGEPVTCREIWRLYGNHILKFSAKHKVNPALVIMTIATETGFAREDKFTGPRTFRWEAHVNNTDVPQPFLGTYSAGPMQCLATTVRYTLREFGAAFELGDYDSSVAPAIRPRPNPPPANHPLYEAPASIEIGVAEIRVRWSKTKDDPILVAAAYNTGGIYEGPHSPWGIRAHDNHLDRAAEWYGDACAVLSEIGLL